MPGGAGMGIPTAEIPSAPNQPISKPKMPPKKPSNTPSDKKRLKMAERRVPRAIIVPISPVRSRTLIISELAILSMMITAMIKRTTPTCLANNSAVLL